MSSLFSFPGLEAESPACTWPFCLGSVISALPRPQAKDTVWGLARSHQPAQPAQLWPWNPAAVLERPRMRPCELAMLPAVSSPWPHRPCGEQNYPFFKKIFVFGFLNSQTIPFELFFFLSFYPIFLLHPAVEIP